MKKKHPADSTRFDSTLLTCRIAHSPIRHPLATRYEHHPSRGSHSHPVAFLPETFFHSVANTHKNFSPSFPCSPSLGLVPLVHMPEMAALLPRFEQLDRAISSTGGQHWGSGEAAEVRDLLATVDTLLQRSVDHAGSPLLVEGLELLEAAVKDDSTRQASQPADYSYCSAMILILLTVS